MSDSTHVGWCANVLAADSVGGMVSGIQSVAGFIPPRTPVGLWIPESMLSLDLQPLLQWLAEQNCPVLGFNAFPQHAFHAPVVKEAVYLPHWADQSRLDYTCRAAAMLATMLGPNGVGGLTTVPIGWPSHDVDHDKAAASIRTACERIDVIGKETNTQLHLAIEPEPGCILGTAMDLARFVDEHELNDLGRRGLLRACLDACHLALMHESSNAAIAALAQSDISIGRLQLSSAPEARGKHFDDILALAEPRWLHQTSIHHNDSLTLLRDLSDAPTTNQSGVWRTHLHVPIHLDRIGDLHTTRESIVELITAASTLDYRPAVEVETYAWSVLPAAIRKPTLGEDIAAELAWATQTLREAGW
jgi:hypothetical protein